MCLVDTTLSGLTFFWEMCGQMLGWPLIGLIIPLEIDYKTLRHQLLSQGAPDGREYRIWGVTPDDPCRLAAWRNAVGPHASPGYWSTVLPTFIPIPPSLDQAAPMQ
jgi:hypothetical protein